MSSRGVVTSSGTLSTEGGLAERDLPRAFGPYTLFDHIGRGGMADIYLASRTDELGGSRHVVIKQILPGFSADAAFAGLLTAEAKLAARLNHANVVQVMDLGRESDRLYIAMEYVEGYDLHQLLRRLSKARLPLPAEFALFIIRETLRGLDYAHRARDAEGARLGIVHRDVSPSNVLISFEGEVKLCDFGIARALGGTEGSAEEGAIARSRVAGKSAYMAPEHARGEEIDARSDVFAAGILLWELSAGRRLYKGTEEQMLALAQAAEIPPVPAGRLPKQHVLQDVLDRALAPDPADRFPTAADFSGALEDYAMSVGLMASQLRFGSFLMDNFGEDLIASRRARERQAAYLDERDPTGSSVRRKSASDADALADADEEADEEVVADAEVAADTDAEELRDAAAVPEIHSLDTAKRPSVPPKASSRAPIYVAVVIVLVAIAIAAALVLR